MAELDLTVGRGLQGGPAIGGSDQVGFPLRTIDAEGALPELPLVGEGLGRHKSFFGSYRFGKPCCIGRISLKRFLAVAHMFDESHCSCQVGRPLFWLLFFRLKGFCLFLDGCQSFSQIALSNLGADILQLFPLAIGKLVLFRSGFAGFDVVVIYLFCCELLQNPQIFRLFVGEYMGLGSLSTTLME